MVVVAIIGILAAIALPSYISHVRQGRRSEAISSLLAVELAQEKWRLSHTSYTNTLSDLGVSSTSENGYYTIGITMANATGYVATATAQKDQAKDTGCTTLTLTLSSGSTSKTPAACWKNDGIYFSQTSPPGKHNGFTLVETMVIILILGILTAIAAPSFLSMIDKQRITKAAEAILSDLRWARGESIRRGQSISITYTTGANWSYTVTIPSSATTIKTVSSADFPAATLTSTTFPTNITTFDPVRGTAVAGNIALTSKSHNATITLSTLGRARICGLEGYSPCS